MRRIGWNTQETTWLVLAIIWAATSVVAWLRASTSYGFHSGFTDSGVVLAAILVSSVSAVLRAPLFLAPTESNRQKLASIVWWLCWLAVINWSGFLALCAPAVADFVLCFAMLLCVELWLCYEVVKRGCQPWQPTNSGFSNSGSCGQAAEVPAAIPRLSIDKATADDSTIEEDEESLARKTVEGTDSDGRRFLSGWVRFHLAHAQKNDSLIIAFCPAIIGESEIELECQPESVTPKSSTVTPNGMRIDLRRSDANEQLSGRLFWHATEVHKSPSNSRELPRSVALP